MAPEVELLELSESGEAVDGATKFYAHSERLFVSVTTISASCVAECF